MIDTARVIKLNKSRMIIIPKGLADHLGYQVHDRLILQSEGEQLRVIKMGVIDLNMSKWGSKEIQEHSRPK